MKKNIGVVIGVRDTDPDSPKYLLDERGEYMHFDSVEEADEYMENNGMNAGEQKNCYVLQSAASASLLNSSTQQSFVELSNATHFSASLSKKQPFVPPYP